MTHVKDHPPGPDPEAPTVNFQIGGQTLTAFCLNNTGLTKAEAMKSGGFGFHIARILFKGKEILIAYDFVPWRDHLEAEEFGKTIVKGKNIEDYNDEDFNTIIDRMKNKNHKKILEQAKQYMKTSSFESNFKDGFYKNNGHSSLSEKFWKPDELK